MTATWEAVADRWNAGSATFSIGVMLPPVEFGSPYTDTETPCQTKNLETSETPVAAADFWGNTGSIEVMYSYATGNLALNTALTDKITMTRKNNDDTTDVVGEISATDDSMIMVMNPEDGEDGEDGMLYMHFASLTSEDDPTPNLPDGLYEMTIPAGFLLIDGAPNLEYKAQWRVGKEFVTETLMRSDFTSTKTGYNYASYTSEKTGIEYYAYIFLDRAKSFQIKADVGLSGIVTKSNPDGYELHKVDIVWDNQTTNGRQLNMYVSDKAYTAPSDLFSGVTPAGTLTYTKNEDNASFGVLSGENAGKNYVGFRANANAQYITSITLTWVKPDMPTKPEITVDGTEGETSTMADAGHKITYTAEEGVTYTYKVNDGEEMELTADVVIAPGASSAANHGVEIKHGTINTVTVIATKGAQKVESEKAYFVTHPHATLSEDNKLTLTAHDKANVTVKYIVTTPEAAAFRATRAGEAQTYTGPFDFPKGSTIQYWSEAANPADDAETLKSAVVNNENGDGGLVGIEVIEADGAQAEYYTVDGIRVAEPENGLYIVRKGDRTYKVIIRK